jgi:hypothetical protein
MAREHGQQQQHWQQQLAAAGRAHETQVGSHVRCAADTATRASGGPDCLSTRSRLRAHRCTT